MRTEKEARGQDHKDFIWIVFQFVYPQFMYQPTAFSMHLYMLWNSKKKTKTKTNQPKNQKTNPKKSQRTGRKGTIMPKFSDIDDRMKLNINIWYQSLGRIGLFSSRAQLCVNQSPAEQGRDLSAAPHSHLGTQGASALSAERIHTGPTSEMWKLPSRTFWR